MKPSNTPKKLYLPEPLPVHLNVSPLWSRLLTSVVVCAVLFGVHQLLKTPLNNLEEQVGALIWQVSDTTDSPLAAREERVVIVAIDDKSLQEVGAWPWSRATLAELSDRLAEYGATSQIFDLVFPEQKDGDQVLRQALIRNNALLGQIPLLTPDQSAYQLGQLTGALTGSCPLSAPESYGYVANASSVVQSGNGADATRSPNVPAGHISPQVASDGSVRFQAPVVCHNGRLYPSLAVAALLTNLGLDRLEWKKPASDSDFLPAALQRQLMGPAWEIGHPDYPLLQIPVDRHGYMRIDYSMSPERFIYISAADVIAGRVSAEQLNNRWVLIGGTAFGLGDLVPSPHSGLTPGVEIQARLITSLLDQTVPYTPQGYVLIQGLTLSSFLFLLFLLASQAGKPYWRGARLTLMVSPLLIPLLSFAVHYWGGQYLLWIGWMAPALYGGGVALALLSLEYMRNRHEKQRLFDNLKSYLPESVATEIAYRQTTGQLQARKSTYIVLSADLRNFTDFQRHSVPEATVHVLHSFFTLASDAIERHSGVVYEQHADALLAVWPADDSDLSDNVQLAWRAASDIHDAVKPLLYEALTADAEALGLGIGIALGDVVTGQIGAERHRSQVMLGVGVSQALSLQALTQDLAYPTLCSERIAQQLGDQVCQSVGRYILPGFQKPQMLFAPAGDELASQLPLKEAQAAGRIAQMANFRALR